MHRLICWPFRALALAALVPYLTAMWFLNQLIESVKWAATKLNISIGEEKEEWPYVKTKPRRNRSRHS